MSSINYITFHIPYYLYYLYSCLPPCSGTLSRGHVNTCNNIIIIIIFKHSGRINQPVQLETLSTSIGQRFKQFPDACVSAFSEYPDINLEVWCRVHKNAGVQGHFVWTNWNKWKCSLSIIELNYELGYVASIFGCHKMNYLNARFTLSLKLNIICISRHFDRWKIPTQSSQACLAHGIKLTYLLTEESEDGLLSWHGSHFEFVLQFVRGDSDATRWKRWFLLLLLLLSIVLVRIIDEIWDQNNLPGNLGVIICSSKTVSNWSFGLMTVFRDISFHPSHLSSSIRWSFISNVYRFFVWGSSKIIWQKKFT